MICFIDLIFYKTPNSVIFLWEGEEGKGWPTVIWNSTLNSAWGGGCFCLPPGVRSDSRPPCGTGRWERSVSRRRCAAEPVGGPLSKHLPECWLSGYLSPEIKVVKSCLVSVLVTTPGMCSLTHSSVHIIFTAPN